MENKNRPYTRIENDIFEKILSLDFSISQIKVAFAFVRKLNGYNKEQDGVSISQIMEITKLSNRAVIDAQKVLQSMNILSQVKRGTSKTNPSVWKINKDTDKWLPMNTCSLVNSGVLTYEQPGHYSMNTSSHTKEIKKIKKEVDFKKIRKLLPEFIQNKMT